VKEEIIKNFILKRVEKRVFSYLDTI